MLGQFSQKTSLPHGSSRKELCESLRQVTDLIFLMVPVRGVGIFLASSRLCILRDMMRYRWSNRHADPDLLVSVVRGFFSGKGFDETRKIKKSKHGIVLFFAAKSEGSVHNVKIVIRSFERGFEMDFESGEDLGSLGKMSSFTTILGGGILVRERLRKADPRFIERLENEFWDYVETRIEK